MYLGVVALKSMKFPVLFKVAIYKYLTNEFVYKKWGGGGNGWAEWPDSENFHPHCLVKKIGVFLNYQYYDQLFSKLSFVSSQKCQFFLPKIGKIAENCDHNIDPWSHWVEGKLMTSKCSKWRFHRVAGNIQQNVIKQAPPKIKFKLGFIL
jgi:hypothetical protein